MAAAEHDQDMEEKLQPELAVTPVEADPVKPRGFFAKVRYYEELLDRKLGIESHSLDRVLPENRNSPNPLVMAFMWASATMNISCFSTGFLGLQLGLSLGQTIPIVIFATLLGSAVTVHIPFFCLVAFWLYGDLRYSFLLRGGVPLWDRALGCAKSPSQGTRWVSTHRPLLPP